MKPNTQNNINKEYKLQYRFDKILGRHLERLIGTSYGIGGLPMNSATISCLMLLVERENEIDSFPSDPYEHYTTETLINELVEMGFDSDQDMKAVAQDMIQNGYIQEEDGSLLPEKSAISMTQLLDRAFPGMPGMNLVAYFIQTMDEVKSERKDLDTALNQFDQILHQQGIPLKKEPHQPKVKQASSPSNKQKTQLDKSDAFLKAEQQVTQRKKIKRQDISVSSRTETGPDSSVSLSKPRILSSDSYQGKIEIREVHFGPPPSKQDEPEEITPDPDRKNESEDPPVESEAPSESLTALSSESVSDEPALHGVDNPASVAETPIHVQKPKEQETDLFTDAEEQEETKDIQELGPEIEVLDRTDDDIEKRIGAFEEDLAMECPLCRNSRIKTNTTALGKKYYRCSNKSCNFISWGKPYHIPCPTCNNTFLVEASGKDGKTILKCPRATCPYWQRSPRDIIADPQAEICSASQKTNKATAISEKPRRKVVKRRRVRRKK